MGSVLSTKHTGDMSENIATVATDNKEDVKSPLSHYTDMARTIADTQIVKDKNMDTTIKGLIGFLCIYFLLGYGSNFLITTVGCVYPGYCSLKAILTEEKNDDMVWLRYWVVFSTFSLLELLLDMMVSWLPGYLIAKCVFLIWCMAPVPNNGSNIIFNLVVLPLFHTHHAKIDSLANSAAAKAEVMVRNVMENTENKI